MPDASPNDLLQQAARVAAAAGPALVPAGHPELLDSLAATGAAMFGAPACSLALLDEATDELVFVAASGPSADAIVGVRLPVSRGIAGWAMASGEAIAVGNVSADPRFARDVAELAGYIPRSILAAPLETDRGTLGVVEVLDARGGGPASSEDLQLLSMFAGQAALSIEGARAFSDLGRVLLDALAETAEGATLAAALRDAAPQPPAPPDELAALAAVFAELDSLGRREREAALALVEDFLAYVRAGTTLR